KYTIRSLKKRECIAHTFPYQSLFLPVFILRRIHRFPIIGWCVEPEEITVENFIGQLQFMLNGLIQFFHLLGWFNFLARFVIVIGSGNVTVLRCNKVATAEWNKLFMVF